MDNYLGVIARVTVIQGATADRVMAHLESFRANTVDAASAYVAISRAREHAAVYTDNRRRLTDALGLRDGMQIAALDQDIDASVLESAHMAISIGYR